MWQRSQSKTKLCTESVPPNESGIIWHLSSDASTPHLQHLLVASLKSTLNPASSTILNQYSAILFFVIFDAIILSFSLCTLLICLPEIKHFDGSLQLVLI